MSTSGLGGGSATGIACGIIKPTMLSVGSSWVSLRQRERESIKLEMLEPHLATADAGVWAHDGAGISVAVPELVSMPWVALRSAVAVVVVVAAVDAVGAVVAVEVVAAAVVVVVVAVATWAAVFHTWSQWQ